MTYPDRHRSAVTVSAVFDGRGVVADVLLPTATWHPHTAQQRLGDVLVGLAPGADVATVRAQLAAALAPFGVPPIHDRDGHIDAQSASIGMALNLVYAILALAVLIAVLGIANTLGLAVPWPARSRRSVRRAALPGSTCSPPSPRSKESRAMQVVIGAVGSRGDVAPLTGLGMALHPAGHRVTITAWGTPKPLPRHASRSRKLAGHSTVP